jgi:hypothetical protein
MDRLHRNNNAKLLKPGNIEGVEQLSVFDPVGNLHGSSLALGPFNRIQRKTDGAVSNRVHSNRQISLHGLEHQGVQLPY